MEELEKQTSEIVADIQSLSHKLHSSKLEYLGIATAMSSFCKEVSEGKGAWTDEHAGAAEVGRRDRLY